MYQPILAQPRSVVVYTRVLPESGKPFWSPACLCACSPALHTPGGPLQLMLGRLLELGAKSWRIVSITCLQVGRGPLLLGALLEAACVSRSLHSGGTQQVPTALRPVVAAQRWLAAAHPAPFLPHPALQLFGLLSRHPELAPHYLGSLQQALLWGTSEDPGQSGVVSVQPCLAVRLSVCCSVGLGQCQAGGWVEPAAWHGLPAMHQERCEQSNDALAICQFEPLSFQRQLCRPAPGQHWSHAAKMFFPTAAGRPCGR